MKQAHICLDETLGVRYAILPGDPARLDRVAAQLESVRELAYNREFRSLTGTYKREARLIAVRAVCHQLERLRPAVLHRLRAGDGNSCGLYHHASSASAIRSSKSSP